MKLIKINLSSLLILLSLTVFSFSCTEDSVDDNSLAVNVNGETWDGSALSFIKEDGSNPANVANQDRITENVWLTRGNNGGQIYNAKSESSANKETSPAGTAWAIGTIDQIDQLDFRPFRSAVGQPKNVVGKELVLYLVEDNAYVSVRFTSWDQDGGGFSYERSTQR